jgi:hypothetical protein
MGSQSLESLRLAFKRAFVAYYSNLQTPAVADPTEAFAAAYHYLFVLHGRLGADEFMRRLDDETTHLAGQVEQDLRRRMDMRKASPDYDDLEDRLRECFEYARSRLAE